MKEKVLICILLFISHIVFGQNEYQVQLRNAETNETIPFATVQFKDVPRGLIADENGQFRLPLTQVNSIKALVITCLGYKTLEVKLESLSLKSLNVLRLAPQLEQLDAIILNSKSNRTKIYEEIEKSKPLAAEEIIRFAINNIKKTLASKAHSSIGYYRDYQIINKEYYNLNEGILEQFDAGIFTNKLVDDKNQSVFYSFEENNDFKRDSVFASAYGQNAKSIRNASILSYGGNELTLLNAHNPIRNYNINSFSFVYRMTHEFIPNHQFYKEDIIFNDDEPLIVINFNSLPGKTSPIHSAKGSITISLEDFAIHTFRYSVFDYNKKNPLYNLNIQYRRISSKMYLNYITFNNRFFVEDSQYFKEEKVVFDREKNRFKITFNAEFNPKTIKRRNFKLRYNDRKIPIKRIDTIDKKTVSLKLPEYEKELQTIPKDNMKYLKLDIRNVYDSNSRLIYRPTRKIAYQFREFFVQEIIETKKLVPELIYIDKLKPLKDSNSNLDLLKRDQYIINSPLKNTN